MAFDFLSWFAGFTDGEGCFVIRKKSQHSYSTVFAITLRDDDIDVLLKIQEVLKIGTVCRSVCVTNLGSCHVAHFRCYGKSDALKLVEIFDSYPLQAKKARDYAIWRKAVLENQKSSGTRDRKMMKYLHDKIRLVKKYDAPSDLANSDYEPPGVQLGLNWPSDVDY